MRERATLPPGLQKKIHSLPPELDPQLRKLPAGYIRVIVGATVVLMNEETSTIFDCSCQDKFPQKSPLKIPQAGWA